MYDCWDEAAEVDEVELAVAEVAVTEVIKIEVAVTDSNYEVCAFTSD